MAQRYCNTCKFEKTLEQFTKYGTECKECKIKRTQVNRERFYVNRYRCECGLYVSDGNPKDKHEKTKVHQNYLKFGCRYPNGLDFLYRTDKIEQLNKCLEGIENNRNRNK